MAEAALKIEIPAVEVRRFYVAALTEEGPWIMDRLLKAYPNQTPRSVIGWLNGVIDNNEFLCLYMPGAVCFAERTALDRLSGKMIVREIFVWCKNPEDEALTSAAAEFYSSMANWAKQQGIDKVIVHERSDVPIEKVREKFGRTHEIKTVFVRV